MSQRKPPEAGVIGASDTAEHLMLAKFTRRSGGFQVPSRATYRQHERWRHDVFQTLKLLEAEGLLIVLQVIPCQCHPKCAGRPVAVGCELTAKGAKLRGFPVRPVH